MFGSDRVVTEDGPVPNEEYVEFLWTQSRREILSTNDDFSL